MNELFILIGAAAPENICWAERAPSGSLSVGQCSLAAVAEKSAGPCRLIVLVPGTDVYLAEVELPAGNTKRSLATIPFAMEENLACDVEDIHFAWPDQRQRLLPVAAVASEKMSHWLAMLHQAGLEPDVMIPTTLALPEHDGCLTIVAAADEVLVAGAGSNYAVDPANLLTILRLALAGDKGQGRKAIAFYQCSDHDFDFASLDIEVREKRVEALPGSEALMAVLVAAYDEGRIINLLQGPFSRHAEWSKVWHKWRLAAVLLVVCLVLALTSFSLDYLQLSRHSRDLTAKINDVYRQTFPSAKKIVNVRAQMAQKLAMLRDSGKKGQGFLDIIDLSGPALMASKGFKLEGMRYLAGRLDLEFSIADLQVLDDLKARLSAAGLAVEIKAATSAEGKVQARMQVRGAS